MLAQLDFDGTLTMQFRPDETDMQIPATSVVFPLLNSEGQLSMSEIIQEIKENIKHKVQ